jgi:protocatechuate 3,4-dioxygenase beta subunit
VKCGEGRELWKISGIKILVRGKIEKEDKEDGKTPVNTALVEIWHCDENEVYDNASDEYKYRGGLLAAISDFNIAFRKKCRRF